METDLELLEANNRLLEKRKAMGNHIQLTSNAMNEFEGPKCDHGIPLGLGCPQCEEQRAKYEEEKRRKIAELEKRDREENEKITKGRLEEKRQNPQKWMEGVPAKFKDASFDNFIGGDIIKKKCVEFINNYNRNEACVNRLLSYPGSILFTGPTGCGKTHLAIALWRELVRENRDGKCFFITVPELLLEIRSTFGTKKQFDGWDKGNPNQTEEQIIDKYSGVELLVLDDLGSEKTSDFTIQSLYLIIDRRNRELKPTIITTNLSLQEIEENINARIASRLADMTIIKINMPDYRKRRK